MNIDTSFLPHFQRKALLRDVQFCAQKARDAQNVYRELYDDEADELTEVLLLLTRLEDRL